MTTADTKPKVKKKGPALWLSILFFLVGAAIASFGGLRAFATAFETITVDAFDVPGGQVRSLAVSYTHLTLPTKA